MMTPQELDEHRQFLITSGYKVIGTKRRPKDTKDLTDEWANAKTWPHTDLCHNWYEPDSEGWYECMHCNKWTKRPELISSLYCCLGKRY